MNKQQDEKFDFDSIKNQLINKIAEEKINDEEKYYPLFSIKTSTQQILAKADTFSELTILLRQLGIMAYAKKIKEIQKEPVYLESLNLLEYAKNLSQLREYYKKQQKKSAKPFVPVHYSVDGKTSAEIEEKIKKIHNLVDEKVIKIRDIGEQIESQKTQKEMTYGK